MGKYFFRFSVFLLVINMLGVVNAFAQQDNLAQYQQKYTLPIRAKKSTIKIDGILDEAAWQNLPKANNFWLKFPKDDGPAENKTEVKTCYDDKFIYFGAKLYDKKPYIGQSLKRDSRIRDNDGLSIVIDPINKKTNGFYFSVTAYNVQADDVLSGDDDLTYSWDNKWYSATKQYDTCYTIEIAIPLKSIRYNTTNTTWGINFIRSDKKANMFYSWTRIPVNFRGFDMGYTGAFLWDKAPASNGKNAVLIPYINQSVNQYTSPEKPSTAKFATGIDAKLAVTNTLNLDLTLNPDFSQVDVDRQVTNLSRFSIFFPERRNFFLENSDLFSSFGIDPIRPFYSRTIGVDDKGNSVPIIGGARLSGNIAPKTRIGILSMQTQKTATYAAQNYSAITAQQQLLKRSSIKTYLLSRESMNNVKGLPTKALDQYGRNVGTELNYTNATGKYSAWFGLHHSIKPTIASQNNYVNYGANYSVRNYNGLLNIDHVGVNYYTDMGFVERIGSYFGNTDSLVRNGFKSVYNQNDINIFPKKGAVVNQHKITLTNFYVLNTNNTFNESNNRLGYSINFKRSSFINIYYNHSTVQLNVPLALPKNTPLPVAKYTYGQVGIRAETDSRKNFVLGGGIAKGTLYNGEYEQVTARVIYRKQPYFTLELNAEYNNIKFPAIYGSTQLFLIAPRIEINFTNNLFWTTFIQYNTQRNNINFNSRLQWRYKPVSDLFIVYTDNYFTEPLFKNKNRALVIKANYWLNL